MRGYTAVFACFIGIVEGILVPRRGIKFRTRSPLYACLYDLSGSIWYEVIL